MRKGAIAQRHKGTKAQRHNGTKQVLSFFQLFFAPFAKSLRTLRLNKNISKTFE